MNFVYKLLAHLSLVVCLIQQLQDIRYLEFKPVQSSQYLVWLLSVDELVVNHYHVRIQLPYQIEFLRRNLTRFQGSAQPFLDTFFENIIVMSLV